MHRALASLAAVVVLLAPVAAQNGNATWTTWARTNHYRVAQIASPPDDSFADLQFFKTVLQGRRIVQLGESGHGVAEFNHAKVRLIKFLHEQMGFDVIAFESGLFECYNANLNAASAAALSTMRGCIFGVWHTSEVLPLFDYIKSTWATPRPLVLAGFDTQISSNGIQSRPAFFNDVIAVIDPGRAATARSSDQGFINSFFQTGRTFAKTNEAALTGFYGGLELFFQEHREPLRAHFGSNPAPRIAERAAWSMLRFMEQLRASIDRPADITETGGGGIRDWGMANNLAFVANELYAGRKIMVWAHNFHIRHDNASTTSRQPTMGQYLREAFRHELYTIGLYMDRGTAAQNDRSIYAITPAPPNFMEWVMANSGSPTLFMDFLHQAPSEGNGWMFQPTLQREWGVNGFTMVPRDQYDGVLFIDTVKSPAYIQ